jgi:hypothetical protein
VPLTLGAPTSSKPETGVAHFFGKWIYYYHHKSGSTIDVSMDLTPDMHFTQSETFNNKQWVNFAGTWSLQGDVLSWRYETSSHSVIPPNLVEVDEVMSVEPDKLLLLSRVRATLIELVRVN